MSNLTNGENVGTFYTQNYSLHIIVLQNLMRGINSHGTEVLIFYEKY